MQANKNTKLKLIEYYMNEYLVMQKANNIYEEAVKSDFKKDKEVAKHLNCETYQLPYDLRSKTADSLSKYPKSKLKRIRLFLAELMLEMEKE